MSTTRREKLMPSPTVAAELARLIARTRMPEHVVDLLGTGDACDEPSTTLEQRRGRCYELCAYAVAFGDAPAGTDLVHGSIHGLGAPRRIGHAWLTLPDGRVWEPMRAAIYAAADWRVYADPRELVTYPTRQVVTAHIARTGHWGPWHPAATAGLPKRD